MDAELDVLAEEVEDEREDVDELLELVKSTNTLTATEFAVIKERVSECQSNLQELSTELRTLSSTQTESPLLTQIVSQLTALQGEVMSLKSSMDTMSKDLIRSNSTPEPPSTEDPPASDVVESPEDKVENPPPAAKRKNRII